LNLICLWIGRLFCIGSAFLVLALFAEWFVDRMAKALCLSCLFTEFMWKTLRVRRTANARPTEAGTHAGGNKKAID
jgi:hypothetical protein